MRRQAFHYSLPPELIAQQPTLLRSGSRLLVLEGSRGCIQDQLFPDLLAWLDAGDLLVFNDTCVVPARMFGRKPSGGRVEMLLERLLDFSRARVQLRVSKKPAAGSEIHVGDVVVRVRGRDGDFFELDFAPHGAREVFERYGAVPLPPYITRAVEPGDAQRYQTVFARCAGAVAAPTAGLHFDEALLQALTTRGVATAFVTLHVGAGTFQPVRVDDVATHRMHTEWFEVSSATCDQIVRVQARGGRVIAVGTTVVRALEAASRSGKIAPFSGETDIFIVPGYQFVTVDGLVTNFHLAESTLLMLVCAFGGYENVMMAYDHAIASRYRFFSYGDAMLVWPHRAVRRPADSLVR
jgi:S-adenosylmethionine:tRNA ribosyltransferase-isomerase